MQTSRYTNVNWLYCWERERDVYLGRSCSVPGEHRMSSSPHYTDNRRHFLGSWNSFSALLCSNSNPLSCGKEGTTVLRADRYIQLLHKSHANNPMPPDLISIHSDRIRDPFTTYVSVQSSPKLVLRFWRTQTVILKLPLRFQVLCVGGWIQLFVFDRYQD